MRISIRDFQSLAAVDFVAAGLTVLVGASNRGKSATIRAIAGALFNRPGEDFVRLGSTLTTVDLRELPTAHGGQDALGAGLDVLWTKGHNLNKFVIDGELYNKVGRNAPPPLTDAGYREVRIGNEKNPEVLRPQVHGQFDAIFLLQQPGSLISDVLSVVSRLAVLLRADKSCSSDLKKTKQLLGVRRTDLDAGRRRR